MCELAEPDDCCTIWDETAPRARKRHSCDSCGGPIEPGEVYIRHKQLYEGDWDTQRACLACVVARETFESAHGDCSLSPRGFPEALLSCIHEGDERSDAKWAPMFAALETRGVAKEPKP